jgi:hypothetical protein
MMRDAQKQYLVGLITRSSRCDSGSRYQIAMGNRNVNKRPAYESVPNEGHW